MFDVMAMPKKVRVRGDGCRGIIRGNKSALERMRVNAANLFGPKYDFLIDSHRGTTFDIRIQSTGEVGQLQGPKTLASKPLPQGRVTRDKIL